MRILNEGPVRAPLARYLPLLLPLLLLLPLACGSPNTPLDADTRETIDSISAERVRLAGLALDTLCQQRRTTELPRLVDSIRQVRLREIQEQLKTVPK